MVTPLSHFEEECVKKAREAMCQEAAGLCADGSRQVLTRVYIASKYWDEDPEARQANVQVQIDVANALIALGYLPLWPLASHYLASSGIGRHRSETMWLQLSLQWLPLCDCILRVKNGDSPGADAEEKLAKDLGIPIYYAFEDLILQERR